MSGRRFETDVSPADWIGARLRPFGTGVGSVVPEGFEAYGRLFHPFPGGERWASVAARNGRVAHVEMQAHKIAFGPDDTGMLAWGSLPRVERSVLAGVLADATTTPDRCWFAVWDGFGGFDSGGVTERVHLPCRSYLLASGSVADAAQSFLPPPWDQSANLWWPEDLAWVVATEIDFAWTYVGAGHAVIDALVAHPDLEVLPARLDDDPTYEGDRIN